MLLENSAIFPDSVEDDSCRPVKDYLDNVQSSWVEGHLANFVVSQINFLSCDTLRQFPLDTNQTTFEYTIFDHRTGESLLGVDDEGNSKFTNVEVVKRMNSQHDGVEIFEGRIQLVERNLPYISKRLFFGIPEELAEKKVYTHYQDKKESQDNNSASVISTEMASACNFLLSIIDYKGKPYKGYIQEAIEL